MADDIDTDLHSDSPGDDAWPDHEDASDDVADLEDVEEVGTSRECLADPGHPHDGTPGAGGGGWGSLRSLNARIPGYLTVHYPERDMRLGMDGDTAIRMMEMFAQRRTVGDRLTRDGSTATAGWVVLDLDEPLALSWLPGTGMPPDRTVLDPPVAALV